MKTEVQDLEKKVSELKEDIFELKEERDELKDKVKILEEENEEQEKENSINSGNVIFDEYIATELSRIINKYGPVRATELLESII